MKSFKINNVTKVFFMALILGLIATSCSKEELVDDIDFKTEQNSTEGDDGEVKPKPTE